MRWGKTPGGVWTRRGGRSGGINITVPTVGPTLAITTTNVSNAVNGQAYSATVQAQYGTQPYTWSVFSGSLPTGLSLNSSTGVISGTPSVEATSNFTIRVTDDNSTTDDQALSITVQASSALYPNEPAGMTKISQFDGTEVNTTDNPTGTTWNYYNGWNTNVTSEVDATNPLGSGYALHFPWGVGVNTVGLATCTTYNNLSYGTVYMMYRIKYDANWEDIGHKNFYWGTSGTNRTGQNPSQYFITREGSNHMYVAQQWANPTSNLISQSGAWAGDYDVWVNQEVLAIEESSVDAGDGKLYVWHNGTLVASNENCRFTDGVTSPVDTVTTFSGFHWYAIRNTANTVASWFRVGELYISAK